MPSRAKPASAQLPQGAQAIMRGVKRNDMVNYLVVAYSILSTLISAEPRRRVCTVPTAANVGRLNGIAISFSKSLIKQLR